MAPQHLPVTSFRRTSFGLHSTEFQLQDEIQVSHTKPKFELLIKLLTRSVRGVGKLSSKANVARVECFGAAESFATISARFQKSGRMLKKFFFVRVAKNRFRLKTKKFVTSHSPF